MDSQRRFKKVGALFLDIIGFTPYCDARRDQPGSRRPIAIVRVDFEQIAHQHGVQKIKTIGDAFLAATRLLEPDSNPVQTLLRCGLE